MDNPKDSIQINIHDENGETQHLFLPLATITPLLDAFILSMMTPNEDASEESKNTAKMMKVAVKGVLTIYGPKVLKSLYGNEAPKIPKGVDIVHWYTSILSNVFISHATQNLYILNLKESANDNRKEVDGISSIPF